MPGIRLTFVITDLHRGGSPLMLAALVRGLAVRGQFEPEVVSIAPLGEVADLIHQAGGAVTSLGARHPWDGRVALAMAAHLRRHRPRLVCSILIHANILMALVRPMAATPLKWVQSLHTVQERPRWHWYAQGMISSMADAIIAPSSAVLRRIERYGPLPRRIVIPNGIDVLRFANAQAVPPENRPWPADARVIGYLGRFDSVKRVELILRAAQSLINEHMLMENELHIALVGYGPEEARLRQLAQSPQLADRVHFLGPSRTPERWYKCFDLLCLPSKSEAFGLVLVEALAAGIPVLTCDTPAIRQTLPGKMGPAVAWLRPDPSVKEIAQAICNMLINNPLQPDIALPMEPFSEELMVTRYADTFSQLLDSNG